MSDPIIHRFTLDVNSRVSQAVILAKVGDTNQQLRISFSNGGVPYSISGKTANLAYVRPGESASVARATVDGDEVIWGFTSHATAKKGRVACEVQILDETGVITSPKFTIIVDNTLYEEGQDEIKNSAEYSAFVEQARWCVGARLGAAAAAEAANSALVELCTGYDGTVYETAGEAVRTQFADVNSAFFIEKIPGANLLDPSLAIDNKKYPDNPDKDSVLDPVDQSNRQVTETPTIIPADTKVLYVRTNIAGKIGVSNPGVFIYFLDSNKKFVAREGIYFNNLFDENGKHIYKTVTVPNGADRFVLMVTGNADKCYVKNVCISAVEPGEFVEYGVTVTRKLRDECAPDSVNDLENFVKNTAVTTPNDNILDPDNSEVGQFADANEQTVDQPVKRKYNSGRSRTILPIRLVEDDITPVVPLRLCVKSKIDIDKEGSSSIRVYWLDKDENYIALSTVKFSAIKGQEKYISAPSKYTKFIHVEVGAKSSGHDLSTECISIAESPEFESFGEHYEVRREFLQKPFPPTKGMKMLVFGDSITETADITKDEDGNDVYNPDFRYNWPSFVQYYLNLDVRNYAKSGATLRDTGYQWVRFIKDTDTVALKPEPPYYNQLESSTWPREVWGWSYVWYPSKEELEKAISRAGADQDDRYADDQNLEWRWVAKSDDIVYRMNLSEQVNLALSDQNYIPDIIVISIGTNDTDAILSRPNDSRDTYEDAMGIGSLKEFTYNTRTTMHKALRFAMWTLKNTYPDARCFIATPIQREEFEIPQYTLDAIRVMANRYGFTIIDAYSESGIIRENEKKDEGHQHYLSDGLHPNEDGYRRMGQLYASKILNAFAFDNFEKERYYV